MRWTDRPCRTEFPTAGCGQRNSAAWEPDPEEVSFALRLCGEPRRDAHRRGGCTSHQGTNTSMSTMEAGKGVFVHALLLHRDPGAILLKDRLSQQSTFLQPMNPRLTREACQVPQVLRAYSDLLAQSRRSGTWDGGSGSIKVRLSEMAGHSGQRTSSVVLIGDSIRAYGLSA